MNRTLRGVVKVASSLGLAGGILVATALPAAAASPNSATAAQATGLIPVAPQAQATYPGTSPVTVASISVTGLLTSGVVTDTAGPTSASTNVASPSVTIVPRVGLTATAVTSSCTFDTNTGTVTGTSSITTGVLTVGGGRTLNLPANPTPNRTITLGGIATITLNRQTTALDGTLTVTAIYISLINSAQTLSIGTSVCNAANLAPVPILPGKALGFTLGGVGLLLVVGVGYQMNRRRGARATP